LIHTRAQISVSTPRIESRKRRTGKRMKFEGMMFRCRQQAHRQRKDRRNRGASSAIDRVFAEAER